jgi:tetratricopeptide (TPR) repeat protein
MYRSELHRLTVSVFMAAVLAAIAPSFAKAQTAGDVASLTKQAERLSDQGRYKDAASIAEKALILSERLFGREHSRTLGCLHNLAIIYSREGRYEESEPLFRRVLEARERTLGRDHLDTLGSLNNLAMTLENRGHMTEAEHLFRRALEGQERTLGKDHPDTLRYLNNLAGLYYMKARLAEAEPLFQRVLAARERTLGKDHSDTLASIHNLAGLYYAQGRFAEAELLLSRTIEARERVLRKDDPTTLASVHDLGLVYRAEGRDADAEPLFRRALEVRERTLGREHPNTLESVSSLASLYYAEGRYGEAEPLLRRAIESEERVLGVEHRQTLQSVHDLGLLYLSNGRYAEAESPLRRALEARERTLGKDHLDTLLSLESLALLHYSKGQYAEAEPLYRRVIAGQERALVKDHPSTLLSFHNLALLHYGQGRYAEAESLNLRVNAAQERMLGKNHPGTLATLHNLAQLYFEQGDWLRAAESWRRSTAGIARRAQQGILADQAPAGKQKKEAERQDYQFKGLVKAVFRLKPDSGAPDAKASRETFETAQWALSSEAAASLLQMAARGAAGDPQLAALIRERQDELAEWQKRDAQRIVALGQESGRRNERAEAENMARLAALEARLSDIDKELKARFPNYSTLASPAPLSAEEVQELLGEREALVLFLDTPQEKPTPEETFIWVVTKRDVRWVRSKLDAGVLKHEVGALRCGLDLAAWEGPRCAELTGQTYSDADRNSGKPLPFDYARAYKLYQALFGQVEQLIKDKQLLLVPSGPLTQLPLQVLVTAPPAGNNAAAAWLIRSHALSVLPAVSSLKALRRVARASAATKPFIGFGNPLLNGPTPAYAEVARLARDAKACAKVQAAAAASAPRGVPPVQTRGRFADVSFLRRQAPLPETADEICAVARDLHADSRDVNLGQRATEHAVKGLSQSGELARYHIVHFATHGAIAGQVIGESEPGLLLTPPGAPSEDDDGYLTASEIAALKLDADWVILSACNTAAGGADGAEALSAPCPRLHPCASARAPCVALGSELRRNREADHRRHGAPCGQ